MLIQAVSHAQTYLPQVFRNPRLAVKASPILSAKLSRARLVSFAIGQEVVRQFDEGTFLQVSEAFAEMSDNELADEIVNSWTAAVYPETKAVVSAVATYRALYGMARLLS